ncbi:MULTISPECIES: hypothetical protein [Pseudomonas]|uniref:hypothetical protein n=1 Tax=Pseudomonas TaxID=286 RepID=UPI0012FE3656|nr:MULTISPECIES: hypothetical protein [Pseudomonas]
MDIIWIKMVFFILTVFASFTLIYLAHRYVEYFEALLPGSALVDVNKKNFVHAGLLGKMVRVCLIALMLSVPNFCVRRNFLKMEEVDRFPIGFRRVLVGLWCLIVFLILGVLFINSQIYMLFDD